MSDMFLYGSLIKVIYAEFAFSLSTDLLVLYAFIYASRFAVFVVTGLGTFLPRSIYTPLFEAEMLNLGSSL